MIQKVSLKGITVKKRLRKQKALNFGWGLFCDRGSIKKGLVFP